MRLTAFIPGISQDLVEQLGACGIYTDTDLVFSPPLDILHLLPDGAATLEQIVDAIQLVTELSSADGQSALELLEEETRARKLDPVILTGIQELDQLLENGTGVGFGGRRVIQIAGDHNTGKSTFVQYLIIRFLTSSPDDNTLWIDTTGDFSPERVARVFHSSRLHFSGTVESVLERLHVCLAFDIGAVFDIVDDLSANFDSSPMIRTKSIVIDTITPLVGPSLSAESSQGHAQMTNLMRHLHGLAKTHGVSVIVVNNATLARPGDLGPLVVAADKKPSLGPSFSFMVDATLWMARGSPMSVIVQTGDDDASNPTNTIHTLEVLTSRHSPSRNWYTFRIKEGIPEPM